MSNQKDHRADVMWAGGNSEWVIVCKKCPWLGQAGGPWTDPEEARRHAAAHAVNPDIERKTAEWDELHANRDLEELSYEQLVAEIEAWTSLSREYNERCAEEGPDGDWIRLYNFSLIAQSIAFGAVHERFLRDNRELRALEDFRSSLRAAWEKPQNPAPMREQEPERKYRDQVAAQIAYAHQTAIHEHHGRGEGCEICNVWFAAHDIANGRKPKRGRV